MLQEELAEGLHLIDFEQLKIENQTYNEKIEERNEVIIYIVSVLIQYKDVVMSEYVTDAGLSTFFSYKT